MEWCLPANLTQLCIDYCRNTILSELRVPHFWILEHAAYLGISACDMRSSKLLKYYSKTGNVQAVRLLIEHGLDGEDVKRSRAHFIAKDKGHLPLCEYLSTLVSYKHSNFSKHAHVAKWQISQGFTNGVTVFELCQAAVRGNLKLFQVLLAQFRDPHWQQDGILEYACMSGNIELAETVFKKGARFQSKETAFRVLQVVVFKGYLCMVQYLIQQCGFSKSDLSFRIRAAEKENQDPYLKIDWMHAFVDGPNWSIPCFQASLQHRHLHIARFLHSEFRGLSIQLVQLEVWKTQRHMSEVVRFCESHIFKDAKKRARECSEQA